MKALSLLLAWAGASAAMAQSQLSLIPSFGWSPTSQAGTYSTSPLSGSYLYGESALANASGPDGIASGTNSGYWQFTYSIPGNSANNPKPYLTYSYGEYDASACGANATMGYTATSSASSSMAGNTSASAPPTVLKYQNMRTYSSTQQKTSVSVTCTWGGSAWTGSYNVLLVTQSANASDGAGAAGAEVDSEILASPTPYSSISYTAY